MSAVAAFPCTGGNASCIAKHGRAVWAAPSFVADTTVVARAAIVTGGGLRMRHRRRAETTGEEESILGKHFGGWVYAHE